MGDSLWFWQGVLSFWWFWLPADPASKGGVVVLVAPADSAFSLLCCPPSPAPLPRRGRGRFLVFLCKGLRPLHPRGLNPWFAAKTTGIDSLRVVPPDTCTAGSVSAAGGLMPGCRGRSPRQNKEKRAPPSPLGKGVGGIGGKNKAKGRVGRRQRRQSLPPGAWFAPGAAVGIPAIKNSAKGLTNRAGCGIIKAIPCGYSLMVKLQLPKLAMRVRFPLLAPKKALQQQRFFCFSRQFSRLVSNSVSNAERRGAGKLPARAEPLKTSPSAARRPESGNPAPGQSACRRRALRIRCSCAHPS